MSDRKALSVKQFVVTETSTVTKIVDEIRNDRSARTGAGVSRAVSEILSLIRQNGDSAVIRLAKKFEGSNFGSVKESFASKREFKDAYSKLRSQDIQAIKKSYEQIRWLARRQLRRFVTKKYVTPLGFEIEEKFNPFARIGGYIPGGQASYPSTVLMICAPAIEAGVKEVVLATPAPSGVVNPAVLVAADICGVKDLIKIGGAQAIGAFAYGTKAIRKAELVAGPGNEFVTEAKKQVAAEGVIAIDSLAGPTELLIIASDSADERLVFEDMVSQAEHGNRTLCGVVSDSDRIIKSIVGRAKKTSGRKRQDKIIQSMLFAVKVRSNRQAVEFAEAFAPEHLEVFSSVPMEQNLAKSGLILSGRYVPCSATDYIVGTNHILPTGGTAARTSGVSVETFLKRVTIVKGGKNVLKQSVNYISDLANLEGLPNHALAAEARFYG